MHKDITTFCKHCVPCQKYNTRAQKYPPLHLYIPSTPLQLVAMDLIGPFTRTTSGNRYALTIMDMLTAYLWAVPIPDKQAETIVRVFQTYFYEKEGGCLYLLSDNGTEFKNEKMTEMAKRLGITKIFSSPYHPQGNSKLEAAHRFLKACMGKYLEEGKLEWDELLSKAACAYNFMPNEHSRETPFFLLKGRDPVTPLSYLLEPRRRYLGDDAGQISLDELTRMWAIAAFNIKMARDKNPDLLKSPPLGSLQVGDQVLVKQHHWEPQTKDDTKKLRPKYEAAYRIIRIISDRQVEVMSPQGKKYIVNIEDVHFQYPAIEITRTLPPSEAFGRPAKFVYHPDYVHKVHWSLTNRLSPKPPTLTKFTSTTDLPSN